MSSAAADWSAIDRLLTELGANSPPLRFWLRDDDAVEPGTNLDRLIGLTADAGVPLGLAVIPAQATPALARRLDNAPHVSVLQHGWSHANHGLMGGRKRELGPERPTDAVAAEIAEGARRLADFPRRQPMLVPPWNRIAAPVAARLPSLGFKALSQYRTRPAARTPGGLIRLNTHLDPVAWRTHRGFRGGASMVALVRRRLTRLAELGADRAEPTGLLTHHLVHDLETFAFLADFFALIRDHPATGWVDVGSLIADDTVHAGSP